MSSVPFRSPRPRSGPRFDVLATEPAAETIRTLRGDAKRSYDRHEEALRNEGCRAAGSRLLADDGSLSRYCCLHAYGTWRVITTFDADVVSVVGVGRHDDARFSNDLSEALGTRAVGVRREQKPGCCGTEGWPRAST